VKNLILLAVIMKKILLYLPVISCLILFCSHSNPVAPAPWKGKVLDFALIQEGNVWVYWYEHAIPIGGIDDKSIRTITISKVLSQTADSTVFQVAVHDSLISHSFTIIRDSIINYFDSFAVKTFDIVDSANGCFFFMSEQKAESDSIVGDTTTWGCGFYRLYSMHNNHIELATDNNCCFSGEGCSYDKRVFLDSVGLLSWGSQFCHNSGSICLFDSLRLISFNGRTPQELLLEKP
jgi:hypothetical protein